MSARPSGDRRRGALRGATLVDASGHLVKTGVHLTSSVRAEEEVRIHRGRGTRHSSAKRVSFDERDTIVFVVSEDGPVTVYAGGRTLAATEQAGTVPEPPPTG
jgi:DNA integrity scanning protein DisA with diadenylate cyclase activity